MFLIGIAGRASSNKDNRDIIQTRDEVRRFLNLRDDVVCITLLPTNKERLLDIEPGRDEVDSKLDFILEKCDGFVIPGGGDGSHFDEYIIKYAEENDKPLLAMCLGFQALCSMHAKNRDKFDMSKSIGNDSHAGAVYTYRHDLLIKEGTQLRNIIGSDRIRVNSNHHDKVDYEMNNLIINSYSDDGIIEGVEYPGKKFILGLQWHPEYLLDDENSSKVLNSFIDSIK